jgi:hypothetical protein
MLFEDLYDSILRRYRVSPPKVERAKQAVHGRVYELLDTTRLGREAQPKALNEEKAKGGSQSE